MNSVDFVQFHNKNQLKQKLGHGRDALWDENAAPTNKQFQKCPALNTN